MTPKRTKIVQLCIDCTLIWPTIYRVSDVQSINMTTQQEMSVGDKVSTWLIPNLGVINMKINAVTFEQIYGNRQ